MPDSSIKLLLISLILVRKKGRTVYIAQPANLGRTCFEDFVKEVADGSTVDVADEKAVLSQLHIVIERLTAHSFRSSAENWELFGLRLEANR